jgi:hypothetical protein
VNDDIHLQDTDALDSPTPQPVLSLPTSPTLVGNKQIDDSEFRLNLFVLMHGYQGTAYDMRLFKNHIQIIYPNAFVLCAQVRCQHINASVASTCDEGRMSSVERG